MVRVSSAGTSGGGPRRGRGRGGGGGGGGGGPSSADLPLSAYRLAVCLILGSLAVLVGSYAYVFSGAMREGGGGEGRGDDGDARSLGRPAAMKTTNDGAGNERRPAVGQNGGRGGAVVGGGGGRGRIRRTSGGASAAGSASASGATDNRLGGGAEAAAATVGYAVSITGCGDDPLLDGAAVLAHSVRLSSSSNPTSGSRYGYKMYVVVHPDAGGCAPLDGLRALGYDVLIRDVPVKAEDIEGEYLRTKVVDNGCCGEKEFVKLEAYTLVDHPIVVHLDLDTVVLRPMDEIFDAMLTKPPGSRSNSAAAAVPTHAGAPLPEGTPIDAYFTRDYNMVRPGRKHVGVQGGFLVLRPSMNAYEEFKSIVREGDFRQNGGWGGKGFGPFYGSMTFQGIVPYFYDELHPGTGVELDRCRYNQMCDNPRDQRTVNDVVHGQCRDGREDCPDCRSLPLEEVRTAHFTLCQKPWWCLPHTADRIQDRLCRKLHGEWFRIRADWEREKGGSGDGGGKFQSEHFYGWCTGQGKNGYIPVKVS